LFKWLFGAEKVSGLSRNARLVYCTFAGTTDYQTLLLPSLFIVYRMPVCILIQSVIHQTFKEKLLRNFKRPKKPTRFVCIWIFKDVPTHVHEASSLKNKVLLLKYEQENDSHKETLHC